MRIILHLADFLRPSSLGGRLSDSSEGLLQRDKGGTRVKRSFARKTRSWYINRLLLVKESNIYPVHGIFQNAGVPFLTSVPPGKTAGFILMPNLMTKMSLSRRTKLC